MKLFQNYSDKLIGALKRVFSSNSPSIFSGAAYVEEDMLPLQSLPTIEEPTSAESPPPVSKEEEAPSKETSKEEPAAQQHTEETTKEAPKTPPVTTPPSPPEKKSVELPAKNSVTWEEARKNGSLVEYNKYTIPLKKELIVEDSSDMASMLPDLMKVKIEAPYATVLDFLRKVANMIANHKEKGAYMRGLYYCVCAAPLDMNDTIETVAKTVAKKTARAMFIIKGYELMYRIEFVSFDKDGNLDVESCMYNISDLIPLYLNATNSIAFY